MGITRWFDGTGIHEKDTAAPGAFYQNTSINAKAYSRLKVEETAYDPKTKKSTIKVTIQAKTSHTWSYADTDYTNAGNGNAGVKIDGQTVAWTNTVKTSSDASKWTDIFYGTVTLSNREPDSAECMVAINSDRPRKTNNVNCCVWYFAGKTTYFPIAATGEYSMPLTRVENGSKVKIGGEDYHIYIGNGTDWVKHNAYIGNGTEWIKH